MGHVGIIGGTGLERLPDGIEWEPLAVQTPFGPASVARAQAGPLGFVYLPRHGEAHEHPPHRVRYRANIAALAAMGVTRVLATNAAGSLRADLPLGSLVLLSDFIDFTRRRPPSYFGRGVAPSDPSAVHTDFSQPYCAELRTAMQSAAAELGMALTPEGVYLCTDGPRFESPAEVRLFARWGADVVGMTGLPEAVFAREAGLCYAAVVRVTNYGAGLTAEPVSHAGVVGAMHAGLPDLWRLLLAAAGLAPAERGCACGRATPRPRRPAP